METLADIIQTALMLRINEASRRLISFALASMRDGRCWTECQRREVVGCTQGRVWMVVVEVVGCTQGRVWMVVVARCASVDFWKFLVLL